MKYLVKVPINGFETANEVEISKIDDVFATMTLKVKNSQDEAKITLVDPYQLDSNYSFEIPIAIKTLLDISDESELSIYLAVVLQQPIEGSIVNFRAPFVFNNKTEKMAQVIFSTKQEPNYKIDATLREYIEKEKIEL